MAEPHPLIQPVDPAPDRGAAGLPLLFFGLLAGPVAWSINNLVDYGLASYACYPRDMPRATVLAGWDWLWGALLALHLGGILLAAVAAAVSYRIWRRSRAEGGTGGGSVLEVGEGRTRFIAFWGIVSGLASIVAIGFSLVALAVLPLCASLPPF